MKKNSQHPLPDHLRSRSQLVFCAKRHPRLGLALAVALAMGLTGCQTTDPFTGEGKTSSATKGAGIGAVGGAIAGALFSGKRKAVLLAAGIGALTGGLVGNYMDQEEAKLRARLQNTGVSVTRVGDTVILNMPGNVTFATGSSNISAEFYQVLDSVALVINEFVKTYVDIVGHTDNTGSLELNQRLSEARAVSVSSYLQSQQVLPQRIQTLGVGPTQSIASNDSPEGRALNRRVEIRLSPLT